MKIILIAIVLALVGNLILLNYKVFYASQRTPSKVDSGFHVVNVASPSAEGTDSATPKIIDSCYPHSCVELIREATASLSPKTSSKATTTSKSSAPASSSAKEFYVSLGSGQTTSEDWQDAPGVSAYIDSTKYGKIKTVTFEASLRIPTANGRVYAQLFNATDSHPVWFSEISAEGDKSQLVISSPITLDSGNKLYKVQMKTSLKFLSILDQARVHIIAE